MAEYVTDTEMRGGVRYKVRLVSSADSSHRVILDPTPTLSETRTVEYNAVEPIHMPGSIQVYKGTKARNFSITVRMIARTQGEATRNASNLQLLRSWTMPYFGAGSSTNDQYITKTVGGADTERQRILRLAQQPGATTATVGLSREISSDQAPNIGPQARSSKYELLGAPPDVLFLSAYSSNALGERSNKFVFNLNKVPVVLTSLTIAYPDDVDYIPTFFDNEPFPVRMEVSMEFVETHSPREYEQFSLQKYRAGILTNF